MFQHLSKHKLAVSLHGGRKSFRLLSRSTMQTAWSGACSRCACCSSAVCCFFSSCDSYMIWSNKVAGSKLCWQVGNSCAINLHSVMQGICFNIRTYSDPFCLLSSKANWCCPSFSWQAWDLLWWSMTWRSHATLRPSEIEQTNICQIPWHCIAQPL